MMYCYTSSIDYEKEYRALYNDYGVMTKEISNCSLKIAFKKARKEIMKYYNTGIRL